MSLKRTCKSSTCLAIGATALVLGISTAPSLAAGGGRGMERAGAMAGRMMEPGSRLLSAGAPTMRVVNVPSSSAAFPQTSVTRPANAMAPGTSVTRPANAMAPGTSVSSPTTAGVTPTNGSQRVIVDPVRPAGSVSTPTTAGVTPTNGSQRVILDPVRPSGSVSTPSAAGVTPTNGSQRVILDPVRPGSSVRNPAPASPVRQFPEPPVPPPAPQ